MMQQYMIVKQKYEDCILMYRVGDFYEMFFDDAIKASKILGLTLTGKDCGLDERAPMCGVPYHSVSSYISGLVENGQKVAICEQLTEPIKGSIVKRDVTRVITSGTRIDVDSLDEKSNNFICSISLIDGQFGVAWADISTGELYCAQITEKGDVSSLLE
ncbi:MAG: DNA mismatch repair protein MutS, partial [Clostridia bacterium]|nr:DNA mismatch repair protein MutS [Clostridia bacterium]